MTLFEIDEYFRSFLKIEEFGADSSQNGIQVQNENPNKTSITKVAFAVDACLETIEQAAKENAQILVVHHGLFWGHESVLTGSHYKRISALVKNNMALYACHIPLDANELVGNNYGLARRLKLQSLAPFGNWHGMSLGVKGVLPKPLTLENLVETLLPGGIKPITVLNFGIKQIKTVAIISGGAGDMLEQAIDAELDVFITGEVGHEQYHQALENGINLVAGGHYQTETIGVSLLADKLQIEKRIETIFIDIPTGL